MGIHTEKPDIGIEADKAVQVVADERFSTTSCDKCEDQHKPKVKPNHINLKERSNICSLANSVHTEFISKKQCHASKTRKIKTASKSCRTEKLNNHRRLPANHSKRELRDWPMAASRSNAKCLSDVQKNNSDVSLSWLLSLQEKQSSTTAQQMNEWHAHLESVWFDDSNKNKTHIVNWTADTLKQYFSNTSNPFALALYFTHRCRDYLTSKSSTLSYFILKQFDQWLKSPNNTVRSRAESLLSRDFRVSALRVVTGPHTTLLDLAVKAFSLNHSSNEYLVPVVKELLAKNKYNQAAQCVSKLQLQSEFSMEEIVLPLILQDKVNIVEDYLAGNADQQKLALKLLDHMCDPQTNLHQLADLSGVENIKVQKLQKKTLSKLACRLMKLYQIPSELCPNISNARGLGALKYLMYKKYIEKSFGSGSWDEMIQSAVGTNAYLQVQLVEQIMCYNDLTEAVKWANYYDLADSALPQPVQDARAKLAQLQPGDQVPSLTFNDGGENWDEDCIPQEEMDKHYHSLAIPLDHVIVVDTKEKLDACVKSLSEPGTLIGIDSEWRPAFANTPARVALLQMAVRDWVYLVDCHVLSSVLDSADWAQFISSIFGNQSLLKLGFGFEGDLKMLVSTFPSMKEPLVEMKRVVNIEALTKQIFGDGPVLLNEKTVEGGDDAVAGPSSRDDDDDDEDAIVVRPFKFQKKEERGLSELVRRCLGKPLCKIEQMSDWERRPLRKEQIVYAALDAYVLLDVYEVLLQYVEERDLDVDTEPPVSHKWCKPTRSDKKKAKAAGTKLPKPETTETTWCVPRSGPPMRPNQLRVVVDTMLQGLGHHLRTCGVDVRILENNEDHEKTIQICRREGRLVLSSGKPFAMIRGHVSPEMCYNVQSEKARDQAAEVLHHFNVIVTQEDIFSRCQVCNGDNYIKIPSSDLKLLYQRLEQLKRGNNSPEQHPSASRFLHDYNIDLLCVRLISTGALLQVDAIPEPMFDKVDLFFCCATCGKVFWEGSHFTRVCDQFRHVLDVNDKTKTVYNSHMQEK